ncbi:hypothetical protein [Microbacterium sp. NPDC055665]
MAEANATSPEPQASISEALATEAAVSEGDELDAALARTASDPHVPADAVPAEETAAVRARPGWWPIVVRWWWVGAVGVLLLLVAGGLAIVSASASTASREQPRPSAVPSAQAGTVPGYVSEPGWEAAAERAVVSADGRRVLVVFSTTDGTTAVVRDIKNGKSLSSTDVAADAAPFVAGEMLLVRSAGTVLAWGPDASEAVEVPAPEGSALLVRSGTAFLVDGGAVTVFSDSGVVSVTAPRAGMVPLGYRSETQTVVWASATGHAVTGAVTGAIVHDVALAAPIADAALSGWIAANDTFAFITWTTPAGTVLAVHDLEDGAVTGHALIAGDPIVSPSGTMIAADGVLVSTGSGDLVPQTEFVPAVFLNDQDLYGTTKTGLPALWLDGKATEVTAGMWQPLALTPKWLLAADTNGIALFPKIQN